jgi:hypothetical protein
LAEQADLFRLGECCAGDGRPARRPGQPCFDGRAGIAGKLAALEGSATWLRS